MNRDDIIKMAQEAGFRFPANYDVAEPIRRLEHFAHLIEKHLYYDGIHTCNDECQRPACVAIRKAVEREREACAQLVEQAGIDGYGTLAAAAMIRKRGEK
jgi:hypothetical protein